MWSILPSPYAVHPSTWHPRLFTLGSQSRCGLLGSRYSRVRNGRRYTPFADPSGSHLKIYKKIDKHCQKATSRSSSRRNSVPFPAWLDEEKEIIDIVLKFLIPKPTMRLGVVKGGAENVRKHAWFKKTKFDWKALRQAT